MLTVRRFLLPALIAALACLQVQCTDKPDRADAEELTQSGTQKYLDGDVDGAFEDFRRAIEYDPEYASVYLSRGLASAELGRPQEALTDFDKVIALNPKGPIPYFHRGLIRRENKDLEGALKDFSTAIALKPEDARAYYQRGKVRPAGDLDAQLADYNRAIALDPGLTDAYLERASVQLGRRENAQAANDFTRVLERNPQSVLAMLGRSVARNRLGDLAGALADCDKAIELDPRDARAYTNRGAFRLESQLRRRLKQEEELKRVIEDLTKAIEIDPRSANAYAERGGARREMGDLARALEDGSRAVELRPTSSYAYQSRGFTWLARGEVEKAMDDFTKMVELAPTNAFARSLRGRTYAIQHDWARSLQDYETALRQDPRVLYPALYCWVMQMHLGQEAAGPLRAALEETAKLPPPVHTASGMAQDAALETAWVKTLAAHLLGEIDQAALLSAAEQSDAEKTRERKCEAWYFMGAVHLGAGRKEEARRCFQECVDTGVTHFVEYQLAVAELAGLKVER